MNDIDGGKSLALSGSLRTPLIWLLVLMCLPLVIATIGIAVAYPKLAAALAQSNLNFIIFIAPVLILLTSILVVRGLMRAGVRIEDSTLVVNTGLGNKRIALSSLLKNGLRVINLNERTELKPMLRLWGTGLPGFSGGWFRLRNGEKAVCILLDRERVSYLRSDDDKLSLLLSLAEPEKLRALLER